MMKQKRKQRDRPKDIDFERREIRLPGRTVRISERCAELLKTIHMMEIMTAAHLKFEMKSWRGGYFKYPSSKQFSYTFDNRELKEITTIINHF